MGFICEIPFLLNGKQALLQLEVWKGRGRRAYIELKETSISTIFVGVYITVYLYTLMYTLVNINVYKYTSAYTTSSGVCIR